MGDAVVVVGGRGLATRRVESPPTQTRGRAEPFRSRFTSKVARQPHACDPAALPSLGSLAVTVTTQLPEAGAFVVQATVGSRVFQGFCVEQLPETSDPLVHPALSPEVVRDEGNLPEPDVHACVYDGCREEFPAKSMLSWHVRLVHVEELPPQERLKCPVPGCCEYANTAALLSDHLLHTHTSQWAHMTALANARARMAVELSQPGGLVGAGSMLPGPSTPAPSMPMGQSKGAEDEAGLRHGGRVEDGLDGAAPKNDDS